MRLRGPYGPSPARADPASARSTASAIHPTGIASRHGGRPSADGGDGHSSKKRSRHGEQAKAAVTAAAAAPCRGRGPVRRGADGPKTVTVGTPSAAARCAGPLSLPT